VTRTPKRRREFSQSSTGSHTNSHRAKKSLGQNFLIDGNIARKIVDALSVSNNETVLEIGPGRGALTRLLMAKTSHLIAIEKDQQLYDSLTKEFASMQSFDLINGDFLDYDFLCINRTIKVVGNIPYNLTSKIISRLVDFRSKIDSAVVMVQEEVADRLAAKPATKAYGAISVRLQLTAEVRKLFSVPPTCFQPMPKVNSRVIRISFNHREPFAEEDKFVVFVKKAFGMRRKMLRHFISHFYGKAALAELPESFQLRRIETLPPEEIYGLFSRLSKTTHSDQKND
jgi:16S rRNA (adenine1518-N6/adenine1519-N6)-dimethyltransferase